MSNIVSIKFIQTGHCFVSLPSTFAERILKRSSQQTHYQTVLELSWDNAKKEHSKVFVGWAGDICQSSSISKEYHPTSSDYPIMELDANFGTSLGLKNFQNVTIKVLNQVSVAERIFVEPVSEDDWELVELYAPSLEECFLKQIRVVFPNQHIPISLSPTQGLIHLIVQNDSKELVPCALLDIGTEVAVKPKLRKTSPPSLCLRLCEGEEVPETKAYVSKHTFELLQASEFPFLTLHLLLPPLKSKVWNTWEKPFFTLECHMSPIVSSNHIHVSSSIAKAFTWLPKEWYIDTNTYGSPVFVTSIHSSERIHVTEKNISSKLNGSHVSSLSPSSTTPTTSTITNIKKKISLIKPPTFVSLPSSIPYLEDLLQFFNSTWSPQCVLMTGASGSGKSFLIQCFLNRLKASINSPCCTMYVPCHLLSNPSKDYAVSSILHDITQLAHHRRPSAVILDNIDTWIPSMQENEDMKLSNYLSWQLIQAISSLEEVYFVLISKDSNAMNPILKQQYIIQKELKLGEGGVDELTKIYTTLKSEYLCAKDVIPKEVASMTEGFLAQDCVHLFQRAYHLGLEGKIPSLPEIHTAPGIKTTVSISMHSIKKALKDYKPLRLTKQAQKEGDVPWEKVGGMLQVKQLLLETFQWPMLYPDLFATCAKNVKLRTGLLLYGYPGCGKTWIGRAIAKKAGLNFSLVRGPELLNKYVGGSEAQVRDVFKKARLTAPCLIFMDEIEALAPKRGTSQVSDRVVNQLLTEMDGVEGRQGVYLLGATSRPDLIDSALLRPGRLDKAVFCGYPDVHERKLVLTTLANNVIHVNDWDFWAKQTEGFTYADLQGWLAQAQLEAVQSYLETKANSTTSSSLLTNPNNIHSTVFKADPPCDLPDWVVESFSFSKKNDSVMSELNNSSSSSMISTVSSPLEINDIHLQKALDTIVPSLTPATKRQLGRIYEEFSKGQVQLTGSGKLKFM